MSLIFSRLKCAGGLADLATRKYKSAAKQFLEASLDHCECPDLVSPHNVAIYGGLTALATFDRTELLKQVISSSQFKASCRNQNGPVCSNSIPILQLFLELEPMLREVINCFYESK